MSGTRKRAGEIVPAFICTKASIAREHLVERDRATLGVAEGVEDPLRRDRILQVARVADEAQPGPYGFVK